MVKQRCLEGWPPRGKGGRSVVSVQRLSFIVNVIRMDTGLIFLGTYISTESGAGVRDIQLALEHP